MRLEAVIFIIFILLEERQPLQSPVFATLFVYLSVTDKVGGFADNLTWPFSQECYFFKLMTFFVVFILIEGVRMLHFHSQNRFLYSNLLKETSPFAPGDVLLN